MLPKLPETTTDQILLLFTLIVGALCGAMIIMECQGRQTPQAFKDTALVFGGGVLGAISAKRLST